MTKVSLNTGNKKGAIQRPGTSHSSPRALALAQRRKEAFDYRLQGHSYAAIGEQMKCDPSTAHSYVVHCLHNIVPAEDAKEVLRQELARLDAMQAGIYEKAISGEDNEAIHAMTRIIAMRCRLLGLFPNEKGHLRVSIGGPLGENAEDTGIQITFVRPSKWGDGKVVEAKPITEHFAAPLNGNGSKP
jgi:hypothetical protein